MKILKQDELNLFHKYFEEMALDDDEKQARIEFADKILEVFAAVFASVEELKTEEENDGEEIYLFFIDEATEFYLDTLEDFGLTDEFYTNRAKNASEEIINTIKKIIEENGSPDKALTNDKLMRIAWTEANIIKNHEYNEYQKSQGKTQKTWVTMGDEKVRLAHSYVDGVTIGIDEDFDIDGYAMACPCDTTNNPPADLIVNCRCVCKYS